MNIIPGAHAKCREGDNCVGPGCRKHRPARTVRRPIESEETDDE